MNHKLDFHLCLSFGNQEALVLIKLDNWLNNIFYNVESKLITNIIVLRKANKEKTKGII